MSSSLLTYPVKRCHFCDNILIYLQYENGKRLVYCNKQSPGCMSFTFSIQNQEAIVEEFSLGHETVLYFRVVSKNKLITSSLWVEANKEKLNLSSSFILEDDLSLIFDKEKVFSLLHKIQKIAILS